MAQKRMLNKTISVSEQVADLSIEAQLLFTWSIAHADDFGLLPASAKKLKGLIVPYWDKLAKDIEKLIKEILEAKLWSTINFAGEEWYVFPKWFDHQDLRRDVTPKLYANTKAKWEDYEDVKKQLVTERNGTLQNVAEVKGSEGKLSEFNLSEVSGRETRTPEQTNKHFFTLILENKFDEAIQNIGGIWAERLPTLTEQQRNAFFQEVYKFTAYWVEKNKTGTKQRWEQEDTFEVGLRLGTWFSRKQEFNFKTQESKGIKL